MTGLRGSEPPMSPGFPVNPGEYPDSFGRGVGGYSACEGLLYLNCPQPWGPRQFPRYREFGGFTRSV